MIRRHRFPGLLHPAVFAAVLGVLSGVAMAADAPADFPGTPPAPGPAPRLNVPAPVAQILPNGLEVVSVRRADLPLVTAQLVLRSGGEMDPADEAGLADLTANLLSKGAGGKSAPQIAAAAEALGGSLQAAAGWDESAVGITVTTPRLPAALDLLATVVRHPDFAPDELKRGARRLTGEVRVPPNARQSPHAVFGPAGGRRPRAGRRGAGVGRDRVDPRHHDRLRPVAVRDRGD